MSEKHGELVKVAPNTSEELAKVQELIKKYTAKYASTYAIKEEMEVHLNKARELAEQTKSLMNAHNEYFESAQFDVKKAMAETNSIAHDRSRDHSELLEHTKRIFARLTDALEKLRERHQLMKTNEELHERAVLIQKQHQRAISEKKEKLDELNVLLDALEFYADNEDWTAAHENPDELSDADTEPGEEI